MTVDDQFQLYAVEEEEGGRRHSLLRAPLSLPDILCSGSGTDQYFNILMADTSGSMEKRWPLVVKGWEEHIVPKLTGRTRIYAFDSQVRLKRNEKHLLQNDFTGYATNLTAAFETIRLEVEQSPEATVRVFIITDGDHNHNFQKKEPDTEIAQMKPPKGKVVCVYVLGIGLEFPVTYSIDIRSHLHNGNSNVPTLYWAKEDKEIQGRISAISDDIKSYMFKLSLGGFILPGLAETEFIHLGEWLYYPQPPEDLLALTVEMLGYDSKPLTSSVGDISPRQLVEEVFPQWNSVLIQQHRKNSYVPHETFDLMTSLFNSTLHKFKVSTNVGKGVKSRIITKIERSCTLKFAVLWKQCKYIISVKGKYDDEAKLAETLLQTTVTPRKYAQRLLDFKGHGQKDFEEDAKEFRKLYSDAKEQIYALPSPDLEECCRITASSTLSDLQDPDVLMLLEESKFDFLKAFTMTGMPVYAPIKDCSQINPWTLVIKRIVTAPFAVVSQNAYEFYAETNLKGMDSINKSFRLEESNEATRCNIVIPVLPAIAAEVLKPLVCSNIYAMLSTFCILKNPHIIDHDAHIAALSCAWFATIKNDPLCTRPTYVWDRLENIAATAKLYLSRPSLTSYTIALLNDPNQALMTRSTKKFEGRIVRCESLIKPMFFFYLKKDSLTLSQKENLLKLLLAEFIGRCLPHHSPEDKMATPYTDFFAKDMYNSKRNEAWMNIIYKSILRDIKLQRNTLLETFYTLDDLHASIKKQINHQIPSISQHLIDDDSLSVDMSKIKKLRNVGGCGDVKAIDFKTWALDMDIPEAKIKKASSPSQIDIYVCEGMLNRWSRDRVSKASMTKEECQAILRHKVKLETARYLKLHMLEKMKTKAACQWEKEYMQVHQGLVMPMTPLQVVRKAQHKGIHVNMETFSQVYRYNDRLQLLRNACQIPNCPHYLVPRNNFNQHLWVERKQANFPHSLHLVSKEFCTEGVDAVALEVSKGTLSGTQNRHHLPPPTAFSLTSLKGQISTLLQHYEKDNQ